MHTFVVLAYKESEYLEDCIKSVINQTYKSQVVIATSTPNAFITKMADKYNLPVMENSNPSKGIGHDFDFAVFCGETDLTTVAHQDDIYEPTYSQSVVERFKQNPESTILFTDYYEIRDTGNVYKNTNLKIKRILLFPLRSQFLSKRKFGKRLVLRFGSAICCPAVTFVKDNIKTDDIFKCDFKCDVDWYAWEKLSKIKGNFSFVNQPLMGHRVHNESTTTEIIKGNIRTKEDLVMFKKFWPVFIAKMINKVYVKSENSNG